MSTAAQMKVDAAWSAIFTLFPIFSADDLSFSFLIVILMVIILKVIRALCNITAYRISATHTMYSRRAMSLHTALLANEQ